MRLLSTIFVYLFINSLICNGFVRSDILPTGSLLGVAPQDESYYTADTIKCKDGSKKFTKSQLNDDFCDCLDGSDEPGTSACPNGSFYCKNTGHSPVVLYSSRVNDAICDCCDGSDEYDGQIKCQNTCWEAGKKAREKLMKKIATYQEGVTIRQRETEKAKLAMAKEESELSKLKDEEKVLKGLVDQLKDRKEQIEKIEEKERLQKEKEEKERMEAELAAKKETGTDEKSETTEHIENDVHDMTETAHKPPQESTEDHQESDKEPDHLIKEGLPNDRVEDVNEDILQNSEQQNEGSTVDGKVDTDDGNQEQNVGEDTESLSREELGRRIASRWTGEKVDEPTQEDGSVKTDDLNIDGTSSETNNEEYPGYDSEEEEHTYDDDDADDDKDAQVDDFQPEDHYDATPQVPDSDDESDLSDITDSGSSSWLEKIQQTVKNIIRVANIFQTPVNISDAAHVRKEYDESSAKLSKIQSRITSLTKKLKQDFGPEKEFYSFHGQCFETKQNKYTYKVCPFKQATQEEGYSTTRLGSWDKFEDSYRVMQFSNGDKCWNGPDRSLKVKLRCGLKNEVTDVDEPSRCEYMALLSTPALCVETKLKELQEKLESLNKKQPHGHDEL